MRANVEQSERTRIFAGAALIVLACLASFASAIRGKFIWDDDKHISQNSALRSAHGLWQIWTHLDTEPQYYPLTHTSFWIDFHLFGLNTAGYHVENILIHACVAIALWRLLRRLETRAAFLAALLFAIHPLQVETVAWISERKNLLSALFEILALFVYWPIAMGRRNRSRYFSAISLFLAAMLSKTVACTMPAVVLVLIWWKRGVVCRRDVWPTIPMFLLALIFSSITGFQEKFHVGARGADWDLSVGQRMLIASRAIWFYAGKIIWPSSLTFSYPRWDVRTNDPFVFAFLLAVVGVFAALFALRARIGRAPLAVALIFVGVLVPALGFVNTFPMRYTFVADHFQYTAGIALIVSIAAMIARLFGRAQAVPLVGLALVLGALTFNQSNVYRDPQALWRDTIAKNPSSWMAQNNLAVLLTERAEDRADLLEALDHFHAVESLRPNHPLLPFNRAEALMKLSRWREAIESYRQGLRENPLPAGVNAAQAHDQIGLAFLQLNGPENAREEFADAAAVDPKFATAKLHLARLLDQLQQDSVAISVYQGYLKLKPNDAAAHASLGILFGRAEKFDRAAEEFSAALSIDPNLSTAKAGLQMALTMRRRATAATTRAHE